MLLLLSLISFYYLLPISEEDIHERSTLYTAEKKAELSYEEICFKNLEKCIFLLLCVRPPLVGNSFFTAEIIYFLIFEYLQTMEKKSRWLLFCYFSLYLISNFYIII